MAGYVKGQMDKGDLAGKYVVLVVHDDKESALDFASHFYPDTKVSVHEVVASHYDIDYDLHKMLFCPAEKELPDGNS